MSERLAGDEESTNVLVTVEILEAVELVGVKESELIEELVALDETSVEEVDAVALVLEGSVLGTLSMLVELESIAGELENTLIEDELPLSLELGIVGDAEEGLGLEVADGGLELSGDIDDELKEVLEGLVVTED